MSAALNLFTCDFWWWNLWRHAGSDSSMVTVLPQCLGYQRLYLVALTLSAGVFSLIIYVCTYRIWHARMRNSNNARLQRQTRKIVSSLFTIWFRYINKKLFSFFYICKILMFWLFACLLASMVLLSLICPRPARSKRTLRCLAGRLSDCQTVCLPYLFHCTASGCLAAHLFVCLSVQASIAVRGEW